MARKTAKEKAEEVKQEEANYETNINVVVRCRGRSEREIRESSVVVVSTPGGLRGREIALSMGPLALNNKTYSFDRVFGPEADQTMIYDDVVAPMLEEVRSPAVRKLGMEADVVYNRCSRATIARYSPTVKPARAKPTL